MEVNNFDICLTEEGSDFIKDLYNNTHAIKRDRNNQIVLPQIYSVDKVCYSAPIEEGYDGVEMYTYLNAYHKTIDDLKALVKTQLMNMYSSTDPILREGKADAGMAQNFEQLIEVISLYMPSRVKYYKKVRVTEFNQPLAFFLTREEAHKYIEDNKYLSKGSVEITAHTLDNTEGNSAYIIYTLLIGMGIQIGVPKEIL